MANLWRYIRRNHLGLIAIFLALNGVAYAAVSTGSVDSTSVRDRSLQGVDLQSGAIHARNLNLKSVGGVLQRRVKGVCKTGQAIRVITQKGSVSCTSTSVQASDLDIRSVSGTLQARVKGRCDSGQAISRITAKGEVACIATADEGKITAITPSGGLTGGGTSGNVALATDPAVLQRRVSGDCSGNEAAQSVAQDGGVGCNPFQVPLMNDGCTAADNAIATVDAVTGAVTCVPAVGSVTAGTGLTGGGGPGSVSLAADTGYLQRRVSPGCSGSNAVQSVNADGTVVCLNTGTGSVTSVGVTAGSGLTASPNPITTTGTLGTDFATIQKRVAGACAAAGSTAVQSINADGTVNCGNLQIRVTGLCSGNEAIQSINADGTVTCRSVVTSVAPVAGSGLTFTPNPITGTGTVGTDFGTIQKRVSDSCSGNTALQSITSTGTVNCSQALLPASRVYALGLREAGLYPNDTDVTLIETPFFKVIGRCRYEHTVVDQEGVEHVDEVGPGVQIIATANTGMNALVDSPAQGFHAIGTVAQDRMSRIKDQGTDMAHFELGGTTGAAAGHTLSGGYYAFVTSVGCQFAATAVSD